MTLPDPITDDNGTTWWRAAGSSSAFTSQREYADPGYFTSAVPPQPIEKGNTTRA